MWNLFLTASVLAVLVPTQSITVTDENDGTPYGVDCTFPIHYKNLRCGNLLGDRKKIYEDYMQGCYDAFGDEICDAYEDDRIAMSLRQPAGMRNYTSTGFKKIRAPENLYKILKDHWDRNNHLRKEETWGRGNIYVNHWASPTYMVSVEDPSLPGAGYDLKSAIWEAARPIIEEWTGMEQQPSSLYGIRIYTDGAILSPHADRLPLVSSCIINVAQDVDEDWVLEVFDRDGNSVNVTMEPGDMVLYESGTLIHGRPFAMKGNFYANVFIHFQPTGKPLNFENYDFVEDLDDFYPPYIIKGSAEAEHWKKRNPTGWHQESPSGAHVDTLPAFEAAAKNDLDMLQQLASEDRRSLIAKDRNGWQPIHEAARGGHLDTIEFLLENGADLNARTHKGSGVSPLKIARDAHGDDHVVVQFLRELGALEFGPDL